MLKCVQNLIVWLTQYGVTVDSDTDVDFDLQLEAPRGYVWNDNGCRCIVLQGATSRVSAWTTACREARERAIMGLRLADEEERTRIEYDFDDGAWVAPVGSAEKIEIVV